MDDLSKLEISSASTDDAAFAWPLYRDFIKNVLFEKSNDAPEWDEDREKTSFKALWNEKNSYTISLDNRLIGWMSATENAQSTTLENLFIAPDFQDCGIGLMIFRELSQQWRSKNAKIIVPISMLSQHGKRLQELVAAEGFIKTGPEGEINKMESNW